MMRKRISKTGTILMVTALATLLSGCLSGGGDEASSNGTNPPGSNPNPPSPPPPGSPTPPPGGSGNRAPTISGNPSASAVVGSSYVFTPTASDPDGDTLTFSIANQPTWATFDPATGMLSGTPGAGTEGNYTDIRIDVSDGTASASLPEFSVSVTQVAVGSATITWTAPTQNTDGSALIDLDAYMIYYGVSEGTYPNQVRVDNPGLTSYVIENLPPDTYFFVATSINTNGVESTFSNVAMKTVTSN